MADNTFARMEEPITELEERRKQIQEGRSPLAHQ